MKFQNHRSPKHDKSYQPNITVSYGQYFGRKNNQSGESPPLADDIFKTYKTNGKYIYTNFHSRRV